jgi:hypothetical protein
MSAQGAKRPSALHNNGSASDRCRTEVGGCYWPTPGKGGECLTNQQFPKCKLMVSPKYDPMSALREWSLANHGQIQAPWRCHYSLFPCSPGRQWPSTRCPALAIPLRKLIARAGIREIPIASGTITRHGLLGEPIVAETVAEMGLLVQQPLDF